ncbi:discoidin domain-containing protein [Hymenobacter ginkgonis]|nr:discoidin domain-containing protein [Hymenobacter ginkgonis]
MAQNDLNLALSKPGNQGSTATVTAASVESASLPASNMNDGNQATRWASNTGPNQSFVVNLGSMQAIDRIRISWEQAYAVDFELQVASNSAFDGYTVVKKVVDNVPVVHNGQFLNEYSNLNTTGQYIRFVGTKRHVIDGQSYGYSIYEFEVFGVSNNTNNNLIVTQKPTTTLSASNTEGTYAPANAFDGNPETRWSTRNYEYQTLVVDFGALATVSRAYVSWEYAYATNFSIEYARTQADVDANNWSAFATYADNQAFYNEVAGTATARFYRILARKSVLPGGGFSIYEFALFGTATPLPVSLLSFTAAPQGSAVAVKWSTATELNNAGFEVQRSADGTSFTALAKVAGAGNSQTLKEYQYLDAAPLLATSYYRLKQVDHDGTATYSPVVAVQAAASSAALATINIYPNPTADRATIEWNASSASPVRWSLTSTTGQLVRSGSLDAQEGHNAQALDLRACAAGSYVLTVESAGKVLGRTRVQKAE